MAFSPMEIKARKTAIDAIKKAREAIKAWKDLKNLSKILGGSFAGDQYVDMDEIKKRKKVIDRAIKAVKKAGKKEGIAFK